MPVRFSSRWRRLWVSGAIDIAPVFFDEAAARIESYRHDSRRRGIEEGMGYFDKVDTNTIRQGKPQGLPSSALDALYCSAQELGITQRWGFSVLQVLLDCLVDNADFWRVDPIVDHDGRPDDSQKNRLLDRAQRTKLAQRLADRYLRVRIEVRVFIDGKEISSTDVPNGHDITAFAKSFAEREKHRVCNIAPQLTSCEWTHQIFKVRPI